MALEFTNRYADEVQGLLRIVAGLLFMQHGAQKLFGALEGNQVETVVSQMGLAGAIEFFGGLLIALGLFSRLAAFIASGEIAAAYFLAHAPQGFWPILNRGELAALYAFVFLFFAASGPGRFSLDGLRGRAGRRTESERASEAPPARRAAASRDS